MINELLILSAHLIWVRRSGHGSWVVEDTIVDVVIVSMVVFLSAGSVSWSGRVGNRRVSNWGLLVTVIAQCFSSVPARPAQP